MRLGYAIFAIAGLTFLGFGVQPPSPDWSLQISENYTLLSAGTYWWTVLFACLAITTLVIARQPRRRRAPAGGGRMSAVIEDTTVAEGHRAPHALELENLDVVYRVRSSDRQVLRGVTLNVKRGEAYGLVGESGLREVDCRPRDRQLPAAQRTRSFRRDQDRRPGRAGAVSEASCGDLRSSAVSMVYQNPGAALNPSIRVGKQVAEVFRVRGASASDAAQQARGGAQARPDRGPRFGDGSLRPSALGRHAAARDHRDGARDEPRPADPGRADDRPRRNGRGGGARPRGRAAGRVAHVRPLHQPQPRDHPQDVRSRRRALRRQPRRRGRYGDDSRRSAASLHRRPSSLRAARWCSQGSRSTRHDPGLHAERGRGAAGLRLRRPLHARRRSLPHRGAGGPLDRWRPHEPLPLPRAGADAAA